MKKHPISSTVVFISLHCLAINAHQFAQISVQKSYCNFRKTCKINPKSLWTDGSKKKKFLNFEQFVTVASETVQHYVVRI